VTINAVCVHFHVSDNRETMSDAETSCVLDDAVFHVDVNDNKEWLCDDEAICVHVHMSDNRESMSEAVNNQLPVDVDNREKFCDDESGLPAF
jgi:hypothetical protein